MRAKHYRWLALSVGLALLSAGCGGSGRSSSDDSGTGASPLVSVEVATQFAQDFEHAVLIQDQEAIYRFFDWDHILDAATNDSEGVSEETMKSFREGARVAYEERGIGGEMCRLAASGGSTKFIRVYQKDDRTRVIFRLAAPQGSGLNYCEFILSPGAEDTCKAIDLQSYMSGQQMSVIIRRMFAMAVNAESQAMLKSASDADVNQSNLQQVLQLTELAEAGDSPAVIKTYEQLPQSVRDERSFQLMYLRAAAKVDEAKFDEAVKHFESLFPSDAALNLLLVDRHIGNQRYEEAMTCLDRVDEAVGGDPYLDVKRAYLHVVKRDWEAARNTIRRAIQKDETMEHAYWMAVTISLQMRRFDETAEMLDVIRDRFKTKYAEDLSEIPAYAEFAASPEYEDWRERFLKRKMEREERRRNGGREPADDGQPGSAGPGKADKTAEPDTSSDGSQDDRKEGESNSGEKKDPPAKNESPAKDGAPQP